MTKVAELLKITGAKLVENVVMRGAVALNRIGVEVGPCAEVVLDDCCKVNRDAELIVVCEGKAVFCADHRLAWELKPLFCCEDTR